MNRFFVLTLLISGLTLSACGKKGPLKLPEENKTNPTEQVSPK